MNKILSPTLLIGFIMTGTQSFISGAHAQCIGPSCEGSIGRMHEMETQKTAPKNQGEMEINSSVIEEVNTSGASTEGDSTSSQNSTVSTPAVQPTSEN